jgi:hypothetical protein
LEDYDEAIRFRPDYLNAFSIVATFERMQAIRMERSRTATRLLG